MAPALLVNAVSFLVSAACLFRVRGRAPTTPAPATGPAPSGAPGTAAAQPLPGQPGMRREIAEGVRYVAGDPYLRPLTIYAALVNLGLTGHGALVIVFLVRVVRLGPGRVGLLLAVTGVGGLLGALLASRLGRLLGTARALLLSAVGGIPFALLIPLADDGPRLVFFVLGLLVASSGIVAGTIYLGSFRQAYCPPRLLGRVTATMRFLLVGTNPLGALLAGGLGTWLGGRALGASPCGAKRSIRSNRRGRCGKAGDQQTQRLAVRVQGKG